MKVCSTCGDAKPRSEYGTQDGYLRGRCRACDAAYFRDHYKRNRDRIRSRHQEYEAEKREEITERKRNYRQRNAEKHRASARRWKQRNRKKHLAHRAVARALKAGRLVRPSVCEGCGAPGEVQAHHRDYEKQLDVEWLCSTCHGDRHKQLQPQT